MLTKMNQTGGKSPFDYVMGRTTSSGSQRTHSPEVIRGDLDVFCSVHRTVYRKNKDTRLALSYDPHDVPTPAEIRCDIDLIERISFPGFKEVDFLTVWVLHRQKHDDAVRQDVHGIWLRQDLVTGKAYNPYFHKVDLVKFKKAKELLNLIRGYEEPSAPEHCRVYGFTYKGTKANEVEKIVNEICESSPINDREELANAIEARGYRVKRRKSGKARGRKSMTVIFADGHEVKLVGNPFQPVAEPEFINVSEEDRLTRINELIAELNAKCLIVAERNWKLYRAKLREQTYEEAASQGFGFEPISLLQLIPANPYEKPKERNRPPLVRVPGGIQIGSPLVKTAVNRPGREDSQSRDVPNTEVPAPRTADAARTIADTEENRRLDFAIEKIRELGREIHTALSVLAQKRMQQRTTRQR